MTPSKVEDALRGACDGVSRLSGPVFELRRFRSFVISVIIESCDCLDECPLPLHNLGNETIISERLNVQSSMNLLREFFECSGPYEVRNDEHGRLSTSSSRPMEYVSPFSS